MRFLQLGQLRIDLDNRLVESPTGSDSLTNNEAVILGLLGEREGQVVTDDELLVAMGYVRGVSTRAVDKAVYRLRHKLGDDPDAPLFIQRVRGVGLRLGPPREPTAGVVVSPASDDADLAAAARELVPGLDDVDVQEVLGLQPLVARRDNATASAVGALASRMLARVRKKTTSPPSKRSCPISTRYGGPSP